MRSASLLAASLALLMAGGAAAQEDLTQLPAPSNDFRPSLTSWGEPDFRGGWPIDHLNGRTPFQRPAEYGNRQLLTEEEFNERTQTVAQLEQRYENEESEGTMGMGHWAEVAAANRRTSWITAPADGQLPAYTSEGQRLSDAMRSTWAAGQNFDWVDDFDSWDRCITRGLPASMFPFMYNNGIRIFQAPGLVALQLEMVHEVRMIPTDGSAHLPRQIGQWMGDSRGTWEDHNTLRVDTVNFRPGPSATNIGTTGSPRENDTPVSEEAHLVERFHMVGEDEIIYEFSWTDPVVFEEPWSARLEWQRDDDYGMYEYACHEGNVQIRNYITASRAERAAGDASE